MLTKAELKEQLEIIDELLLTSHTTDYTDKKYPNGHDLSISNYADYKYYVGKRDMIVKMLKPRKRTKKKDDTPTHTLPEFGIHNPITKLKPRELQ